MSGVTRPPAGGSPSSSKMDALADIVVPAGVCWLPATVKAARGTPPNTYTPFSTLVGTARPPKRPALSSVTVTGAAPTVPVTTAPTMMVPSNVTSSARTSPEVDNVPLDTPPSPGVNAPCGRASTVTGPSGTTSKANRPMSALDEPAVVGRLLLPGPIKTT